MSGYTRHTTLVIKLTQAALWPLLLFFATLFFIHDVALSQDREELSLLWKRLPEEARRPEIPPGDEDAHVVVVRDSVYIDDGGWVPKEYGIKTKTYKNSVPDEYTYLVRKRTLLVRDDQGVDQIGIMELPLEEYTDLVAIYGRVVKPDGSERFLDDDEFHKRTVVASTDLHVECLVAVVPDLAPGDLVDLIYKTRTKFDYAPPIVPLYDRYPICEMTIAWRCREQLPSLGAKWQFAPHPHILNPGEYDISMSPPETVDGLEYVTATIRGSTSVKEEPDMGPSKLSFPAFVPGYRPLYTDEWESYWAWAQRMGVEDREAFIEDGEALDEWMRGIASKTRDREEDFRYCLNVLHKKLDPSGLDEEGRRRARRSRANHSLKDVVERERASDRERNWVLVAMLRSLGYDATTAWCGLALRGRIDDNWHSSNQFDTEVVSVLADGGTRFLFPSFRGATPSSLPYELLGGKALITKRTLDDEPREEPFAKFARGASADNLVDFQGTLDASVDPPRAFLQVYWECPTLVTLRNQLEQLEETDAAEELRQALSLDEEWISNERVRLRTDSFSYECSLTVNGMVEDLGEYAQLDLTTFVPERRDYPIGIRRTSPVDLGCPRKVSARIEVILPDGATVEPFDATKDGQAAFADFSIGTMESSGRLYRRVELELKDVWLGPERYPATAAFFAEYMQAATAKITIKRRSE